MLVRALSTPAPLSAPAHRVAPVTLHLHTAERTDALADGLADLLVTPLPDPFAREVVVVPARGVERWLTQRLSHRLGVGDRGGDGVCAGVDFVTPHSLVSMLLDRDADDPWSPDRLAWPLLAVIDDVMGAPGFEDLTTHLGGGDPGDDRSAPPLRRRPPPRRPVLLLRRAAARAARRLGRRHPCPTAPAASSTPTSCGRPTCGGASSTSWTSRPPTSGTPGPWRGCGPAAAPGSTCPLASRSSATPGCRRRRSRCCVRSASSARCTCGCRRPRPSCGARSRPPPGRARCPATATPPRRWSATRCSARSAATRGSCARTLGDLAAPSTRVTPAPDTLLGWLQHGPAGQLRRPTMPRPLRTARTTSTTPVQVHACHGTARQVDVLREVLVGLLEDDPTLEPRDILVMVPRHRDLRPADLGRVRAGRRRAGRTSATRATGSASASRTARSPRPTRCSALAARAGRAGGRPDDGHPVLDVAAIEPVRARFGLHRRGEVSSASRGGSTQAAVRWGYDRDHRAAFGLRPRRQHVGVGLQRVLLGAAMSGSDTGRSAGTLPLDDVGDGDLELVGASPSWSTGCTPSCS